MRQSYIPHHFKNTIFHPIEGRVFTITRLGYPLFNGGTFDFVTGNFGAKSTGDLGIYW